MLAENFRHFLGKKTTTDFSADSFEKIVPLSQIGLEI